MTLLCDPGGIRTHDPQLRRLLLYPAELLDLPRFFEPLWLVQYCFASAKLMISFYSAKFNLDYQALDEFFRMW